MSTDPLGRLLIVDDEAPQMRALCDTLTLEGYETFGFSSARAALDRLREGSFDLLLTDLMMPEMDGIALLREALQQDSNLVGIVMTGQGTITTAVEAMKTGAFDYVLKPFKLREILPVLARALAMRQLKMKNAELEIRVRERTEELEVANRELEAFSYSVSHDLRAPLRHIGGYSGMLLKSHGAQLSPEARKLMDKVVLSTERMGQLIEGLLQFSRLGRQAVAKNPLSLTPLVQEVWDGLGRDLGNRSVDFRLGALPDCQGDLTLLRQVYVNLLSNALKFTRQKETACIEVGCSGDNGDRVYFVRDNGAGFDMKYVEKLFGVFQRLHAADQFEGTGVGLSLVQRIIQRHGGKIWAEGAVDQGATFYFTLPAVAVVTEG